MIPVMSALTTFRKFVPLLIVMVALLFFFPVAIGSYQATHGPTSTLREYVTGVLLLAFIALLAPAALLPALRPAHGDFGPVQYACHELVHRAELSLRC